MLAADLHGWRRHPADPIRPGTAHSSGHWEGKTLVVDTVGFNDKFWFDYKGHPHYGEAAYYSSDITRTIWAITGENRLTSPSCEPRRRARAETKTTTSEGLGDRLPPLVSVNIAYARRRRSAPV